MNDWLPASPLKQKSKVQLAADLYKSNKKISICAAARALGVHEPTLQKFLKLEYARKKGICPTCLRKLKTKLPTPGRPSVVNPWRTSPRPPVNPEKKKRETEWRRWKQSQKALAEKARLDRLKRAALHPPLHIF